MNFTVKNFCSQTTLYTVVKVQYTLIKIQKLLNKTDFIFYYNKSDITLTVLDGGNEIILANWPDEKHIICTINDVIPIEIPSHPYVLVNRSVLLLCNPNFV